MLSSEVVCYCVFDEFVCSPRKNMKNTKAKNNLICQLFATDSPDLPSTIGYSQHLATTSLTDVLSKILSSQDCWKMLRKHLQEKTGLKVNKFSRGSNKKQTRRATKGSWHMPWRPMNRPPTTIPPFGGRPRRRARCSALEGCGSN